MTDIGNLGNGIVGSGGGVGNTARLGALVVACTLVAYGVLSLSL